MNEIGRKHKGWAKFSYDVIHMCHIDFGQFYYMIDGFLHIIMKIAS